MTTPDRIRVILGPDTSIQNKLYLAECWRADTMQPLDVRGRLAKGGRRLEFSFDGGPWQSARMLEDWLGTLKIETGKQAA